MGRLTTHVLDTVHGQPGAAVKVELFYVEGAARTHLRTVHTNSNGRTDEALLEGGQLRQGTYELVFHVGAYFSERGFLDIVPVRFNIDDPSLHYHVPLLCSPWSYMTYRGS